MPRSVRGVMQLLILCIACAGLVPVAASAQSLKERLVGTWTLVSEARVVDDVEHPGLFGPDPVGQFMFAPDGHMCFNAMRRDRTKFASNYPGGTSDEKTAAYESYVGYCGRYEVNEEERSIVFRVELSTYPNWTGTMQKRFADITGTRLRINTPPILSAGKKVVGMATWERAK